MGSTFTSARRKRSALLGAAALTAGTLGALDAVPASGSIGEAGLRPGKTITVVHNLDMVTVGGYRPLGRKLTVQVLRQKQLWTFRGEPEHHDPRVEGLDGKHDVGPEPLDVVRAFKGDVRARTVDELQLVEHVKRSRRRTAGCRPASMASDGSRLSNEYTSVTSVTRGANVNGATSEPK